MINSLFNKYIFEPFNNISNVKNINNNSFIQISLFLFVLSIYFYLNNLFNKAGIFFVIAYIVFKVK